MNIMHLKYAVEIANEGSINKAAKTLLMGQPNLSRAIKELEESLGITIFSRSAKGMFTTPDGEEFLNYAKKILQQIDDVENIYKKSLPQKQKFSISVPRASYISDAFASFSNNIKDNIDSEVFYQETNSMRAIDNVLHSDYKLGIIRYAENYDKYFKAMLDEKDLSYEMITEFNYLIIFNKESALNEKEKILMSDLSDYIEIAHADPYVPSLPISEVRKEEISNNTNKKIFVFERASQFDLLYHNKKTFMWVSPVPSYTLKKYNLIQKKCEENKKIYKDVLIYKKNYRLSELDKCFITELCNSKRKYI